MITEASLRYRWGMHGDRREQIEHLWEMSKRRNIELRIQRFDDGPPTGLFSMVNIFDFPGGGAVACLRGDRLLHRRGKRAGRR